MINDISDFGEIKSVIASEEFDVDRHYRSFIEKKQKEIPTIITTLHVNFPTRIVVEVEYEKYILEWSCFETQKFIEFKNSNNITLALLVDSANLFSLWNNPLVKKIEVSKDIQHYYLEIFGLKFFLGCVTYKK